MANQGSDVFINFSLDYITKTWIGKLKCAELFFTLLCGACISAVDSYGCGPKFGFASFVAWTAFFSALIDMIIHLLGLWERLLWIFRHPAIHAVLDLIAVVAFLIGASLVASCTKSRRGSGKSTAGAAAFFGFVCMVLFALEALLHFQKFRSMQEEARQQTADQSKPPDYIEPPLKEGL